MRLAVVEGNVVAFRVTRSSRRLAAVIGVLFVVGLLAAGVLFARDRVLTHVLANVEPPASASACAKPCRGGRMLLL